MHVIAALAGANSPGGFGAAFFAAAFGGASKHARRAAGSEMALQSVAGAQPRIRMLLIPDRPAPKRNLGSKAFANVRKMMD